MHGAPDPAWRDGGGAPAQYYPMAAAPPPPPLPGVLEMDVESATAHVLRHCHRPHYCLGLPTHATADDIRKQYKQLALRLHPDKSGHPLAREAFDAIHTAFNRIYPR